MIGFPFDSQITYESDGTPVYDRAISSEPLRQLIKKLLSNGVLPNPSTNLQVQPGTGMTLVVNPGFAVIEGGLKYEEKQRTLVVQASDNTYDRIDTVVMRWNDNTNARNCDLYVVQGVPASNPVRPMLNRESSVYEIGLADVFIAAGSSAISMARITDTRYEAERCGIISAISEFDSNTIYNQIQADLSDFKAYEQAEFLAWFERIREQLSEDAAGNLQLQIGDLNSLETEEKGNLVAAMNELYNMSPETVDPMQATETGFAADALAVKQKFDEQNNNIQTIDSDLQNVTKNIQNIESNFSTATKTIGDILVAKGCSVPSGTSLSEMATLLKNNVIVPIDLGVTSSNTGTLGTASASSYYSAGNNQAYKAFDTDGYTSWHSTEGMPQWIQFQFKTARIVKKIFLQNRCDDVNNLQYVKTFDLLASNDNSSWKTLGSYTHSKTTAGSGAFYTVNNSTAYKYYRIKVKTAQTSYCAIGALQFYC